jgi:hypothetical protein
MLPMTREVRITIEAKDILAIEYECGHCHARHLIPVERFDRVLHQCPNCKESLATLAKYGAEGGSDESILSALIDALKRTKNLSCKIRLQITEDPPPDPSTRA